MAQFNCDGCGYKVSDVDVQCPKCNAPIGKLQIVCKVCGRMLFERDATLPQNDIFPKEKENYSCPNNCNGEVQAVFRYSNNGKNKYDASRTYLDRVKKYFILLFIVMPLSSSLTMSAQVIGMTGWDGITYDFYWKSLPNKADDFDKFDIVSTYMHGFSDYEGDVSSMTISQYTSDRRLLKESIFHFNPMQKIVSYKVGNTTVNYMYNGPLLQSVSLDLDNNLNSVSCFLGNYYVYNGGKLLQARTKYGAMVSYKRDANGRVIQADYKIKNYAQWIFRYEYGINDNIVTIKAYDANGKYLDAKVESVYDDKGRLISRLMKKNSEILYKYQYDDKDNLIYEEEYLAYDTHPRIYDFHKYENTYDSKGHLISVFRYTGSYKRNMRLENRRDLIAMGEKAMKIERKDYTISGKVSYKYDANGNWIEQKTNFSGQEQVIYRLFQYRKNGLWENQYKGENQNLLNDDTQYKSATEPQHPEGKAGLFRFLAKHIKYPTLAQENNIKGRVDVRFVVNEDGKLSDFEISKSVHPYLDNEALRVAKLLPRFIPALDKQGNPVRAYSTVSFTF